MSSNDSSQKDILSTAEVNKTQFEEFEDISDMAKNQDLPTIERNSSSAWNVLFDASSDLKNQITDLNNEISTNADELVKKNMVSLKNHANELSKGIKAMFNETALTNIPGGQEAYRKIHDRNEQLAKQPDFMQLTHKPVVALFNGINQMRPALTYVGQNINNMVKDLGNIIGNITKDAKLQLTKLGKTALMKACNILKSGVELFEKTCKTVGAFINKCAAKCKAFGKDVGNKAMAFGKWADTKIIQPICKTIENAVNSVIGKVKAIKDFGIATKKNPETVLTMVKHNAKELAKKGITSWLEGTIKGIEAVEAVASHIKNTSRKFQDMLDNTPKGFTSRGHF